MNDNDIKRVSRLTAIITQLQTKRLLTAAHLSMVFGVSIRTIYRDMKALEQAGVPIVTIEGKGYSLMEGYRVPPVMFTEAEANALITAEKLIAQSRDSSLTDAYREAAVKIKAVLQYTAREKAEILADKIAISPAFRTDRSGNYLAVVQQALTSFKLLQINYQPGPAAQPTSRQIEPFALYYSLEGHWLLIAYCRLRKDFRMFRLDKIRTLKQLDATFAPHPLSLQQFLEEKQKKFSTPDIPLS
jgi:predicted DNA-binding transcriptional regulator YafY